MSDKNENTSQSSGATHQNTAASVSKPGGNLPLQMLITFFRGCSMGAADIVPGVSGGTVALVFGIYEQLLANVRKGARVVGRVAKGNLAGALESFKSIEWLFLFPLLAGIGAAVVSLASLIEGLLEDKPETIAGLFFGLVAGSIIVAWGLLHSRTKTDVAVAAVVGALAFFLLGFQSGPVSDPPRWGFFVAGAIAICAMILPGISGSFLLLMMGMYAAVLGAVHDRESDDFANLGLFMVGAVLGLALFSTGLGWVLENHHDLLLAGLIGLMIGSFRVLWPWPNGVGIISEVEAETVSGTSLGMPDSAGLLLWPTLLAFLACFVVILVGKFQPGSKQS